MTLGGWIVYAFLAGFIIVGGTMGIMLFSKTLPKVIGAIVIAVLCIALLVGMFAWFHKTESGKRALKTWESETNQGIDRKVRVYDVNGELIEEYSGRFDVDYDECRIVFDDQEGKRHVIYYTTGTVIIDEV